MSKVVLKGASGEGALTEAHLLQWGIESNIIDFAKSIFSPRFALDPVFFLQLVSYCFDKQILILSGE